MKLNKAYTTFILIIVLLITGCSKNISVKKVDINTIKNKQEIAFDSIYNVNYIIKNPNKKNYKVSFSMELGNNGKYDLGEFYINKEEFTNNDDILITLNFDKTEESKFTISRGTSIIRDKRVIDKQIATSNFDYFKNKDIYITESNIVNEDTINEKIHIANINCKDIDQDAKIYLEILESDK